MAPEELDAIRHRARAYRFAVPGAATIAAAMSCAEDVPSLLAEVERLQALVEAMRADGHAKDCDRGHTHEISCKEVARAREKARRDPWWCQHGQSGYHRFVEHEPDSQCDWLGCGRRWGELAEDLRYHHCAGCGKRGPIKHEGSVYICADCQAAGVHVVPGPAPVASPDTPTEVDHG